MRAPRLLQKVLIGQVVLFAIIGTVVSIADGYTLYTRLTAEFTSKGTAIATAISNASDEMILTRDASTIQSLVDQFRLIRGVGYVFVVDDQGTIISHTFVPAVPEELRALQKVGWEQSNGDEVRTQAVTVKGGGDYIDLSAPILAGVAGSVHVGMDRNVIRTDIRSAIIFQVLVVVGLFIGAVGVALVVVRSDAARLAALSNHASAVATQDFEAGLEPAPELQMLARTSTDEIGDVARGFVSMEGAIGGYIDRLKRLAGELAHYNETLETTVATRTQELQEKNSAIEATLDELKQAQDQILRQEKMASLGALTAGIAHEIKNPLNFVNNFSDLSWELLGELREDLDKVAATLDAKTKANVEDVIGNLQLNLSKIKEHGVRADGIVRSMLLHSRGNAGQRQDTDLNALVRDAVGLAYHGMRAQDTSFQVAINSDFDQAVGLIDAVPQDLMRAFLNIVNNGCYAAYHRSKSRTDGSPEIRVRTRRVGDSVEIRFRDDGDGIPEAIVKRIFEPFFTTKPAGQGTGLGLSICHDIIVEQHKGTLAIDTEPGAFTEFIIVLPGKAK